MSQNVEQMANLGHIEHLWKIDFKNENKQNLLYKNINWSLFINNISLC